MRIAQLTLNVYENYGNMLQKFAFHCTLKKFADFVEVLWHCQTEDFPPAWLERNRLAVAHVRDIVFRSIRQNKIKDFDNANIRTRFDVPYIEDIGEEYDYFVVGSDQVWNPEFFFPGRFLEFAPPEKRIAYAASIAVAELPEHVNEYYRRFIAEMPHVSLREREGCDLVEKLTGKRPLHLLDPVFLLTAEEWRKFSRRPLWLDNKLYDNGYLLTYFFDGRPPAQIKPLAEKLGLPIINLYDRNNFNHYVTGIEEFLYLVDNATLICTQSFHGLAFSTIFKRPFILCVTPEEWMDRKFSRIKSLLELFGLTERAVDIKLNIAEPLNVDFTRRDEVLPVERDKAFKFLSNALGVKPREKF